MVTIRHGVNEATWDGDVWTSERRGLATVLNKARFAASGYLPESSQAIEMAIAALGETGWTMVSFSEPEYVDGRIY